MTFEDRVKQIEKLGYRHEIVTVERWRNREGHIFLRESLLELLDEEFLRYLELRNGSEHALKEQQSLV